MKATSKLISVVLILAMCLSLFTVSAFADTQVILGDTTPVNGIPAANSWVGANRQAAVVTEGTYQSEAADEDVPVEGNSAAAVTDDAISTSEALVAAAARGGEIKLANDIVLTESLVFNTAATLDLNGKTLRFDNSGAAQDAAVVGNAAVTIKNGTLVAGGSGEQNDAGTIERGFKSVAAGVTLNNVNVRFKAPADWSEFSGNVGLVYGTYDRDVSAYVDADVYDLVADGGIFVLKDKAPAMEEPAVEEPVTEEPADEEPADEEPVTEEPAAEEPVAEEPASEPEQADVVPEEAGEEAEQADVEVEQPAEEAEQLSTDDENAEDSAATDTEQTNEAAPAEEEPADETPVNVVEEEEKTYEDEVRVNEEEEADASDVVTLTGVDEVTGAVVVVSGKNLPEGLTVVVKPLSTDMIGGLEEGERALLALDISLVDADGNEYEPKDDPEVGAVSVQIKHASLGNLEEDETLTLYHIVDDVAQTVGSEGEGDTLDFATGSFSPFVITAKTGDDTVYSGSTGEVHRRSVSIKNLTGDIYVIDSGSDLTFEISGGAAPESISIIDPDDVSSGNAAVYKAGYLIYKKDKSQDYYFDGYDPATDTKIPDPLKVVITKKAIENAPTGKWAIVFWFKDTTDSGSTRVYMVQYVTIVPKKEIKALLPMDEFGNYYFNKCNYDPMEFYLSAELDKLTITNSAGKVVVSYDYSNPKYIYVSDKNGGNTKRYSVSEMLSLSDYVTTDPVSHEFVAGKSLKLFSSLVRKLDFDDYKIHIWQKNHSATAEPNDTDREFAFSLLPGITVADGLNDYIKGSNLWIKFVSCWPIDYDSDGTLAIWIGGQKISHDYYSISNDHQTLWIYRNLLDQLRSNNSYTLTARLWRYDSNGQKETFYPATAQFNILAAGSTSYKSPKTGDNSNVALWAAVLVLSGGAVVALVPKKKKVSK